MSKGVYSGSLSRSTNGGSWTDSTEKNV